MKQLYVCRIDFNWRTLGYLLGGVLNYDNNIKISDDFSDFHGSFAIVQKEIDAVRLVSDRIASIPLFYTVDEDEKKIYVSDDTELIRQYTHQKMDERRIREYLCFSYTIGNETLYANIYTALPGEQVIISTKNGTIKRKRYFSLNFKLESKTDTPMSGYLQEFDKILSKDVFPDMIERLKGHMAVIPISGGQDSKTIITLMKRLGYPKMVSFSYGKKSSPDVLGGKKVSKALGIPWKHIEWDGACFKKLLKSQEFVSLFPYSVLGCRSYMALTYMAYKEMVESGFIDKDAVIISGSALDFVAGGHIPNPKRDFFGRDELIEYIYRRHALRANVKKPIIKRLTKQLNLKKNIFGFQDWCRIYCQWEYDNRQSKFIANEKRAADILKLGFEMPFWDDRVVSFFLKLPVNMLYDRALQTVYSIEWIDREIGLKLTNPVSDTVEGQNEKLRSVVKKFFPFAINWYHILKQYKTYELDGNGYIDYQSKVKYLFNLVKYGPGYNLNAEFSAKYIEWKKKQENV